MIHTPHEGRTETSMAALLQDDDGTNHGSPKEVLSKQPEEAGKYV